MTTETEKENVKDATDKCDPFDVAFGRSRRSQRVSAVVWLVGITAVVALGILSQDANVGMGLGVVGVSGMVTVVSYFILREK